MNKFTKLLSAMAKGREIVIKFRNGRVESGTFIDGNRNAIRIKQATNVETRFGLADCDDRMCTW